MSDETYVVDETAEAIVDEWERQDADLEYGLTHDEPED